MRTAFINQLIVEAEKHPDIVLVIGDLGYNVVNAFEQRFPDRFFNAGIAEQSMAGMAAGLAHEGFNVYLYSIGNFPTLRCIEQLRYDVAYHNLSAKIVSIGAGYAYGSMGASHHGTEDIGMMRTIPGTIVATPSDPAEAMAVTTISANTPGMMYLRLGKARETVIHTSPLSSLKVGDLLPINVTGQSRAVIACGSIAAYARDRVAGGYEADLYTLPFVKPINREQLTRIAATHDELIVIEEHQRSCGAGSAVLEQLGDAYFDGALTQMPRVKRVAIPDEFCHIAGTQQYLRDHMGLTL